jgi:hypothetical protein
MYGKGKGAGKGGGGGGGRGNGGDWRSRLKTKMSEVTYMSDPVPGVIVSSDHAPMGVGIPGKVINYETNEAMHRMVSPADDFTYLFSWYQGYWVHLFYEDSWCGLPLWRIYYCYYCYSE